MTWEDDFMCVTQSAFSEMRLLVEGAIVVYEDDAGILCNLARDAEKYDALRALNDVGTALKPSGRYLVTHVFEHVCRKVSSFYCLSRCVWGIEKSLENALVLSKRCANLKTYSHRG